MYRVLCLLIVGMTCATSLALGADIPSWVGTKSPVHHRKITPSKPPAFKAKKIAVKKQLLVDMPIKPELATKSISPVLPVIPEPVAASLSWVLNPLAANADGGKNEGSASETGYIVVEDAAAVCGSEVIIDLEGHIVKTANSTARLDIHIGKIRRTVVWNTDEIKSGGFKISLNEKDRPCVEGDYIPASALAFVTKEGDGHAAMVSLEKITLRYRSAKIAGSQ